MLGEITRVASRALVKTKIASPTGLFVIGLVGVGAGTVLAVRATMKAEPHLDRAREELQDINSVPIANYSSPSGKTREKVIVYAELTYQLSKLYAPGLVCTGIGVACLTQSHRILTSRNAALAGAYAGLDRLYREYRKRVRDEVGEVREDRIHRQAVGHLVEQDRGLARKDPYSSSRVKRDTMIYARIFDESNPNWKPSAEFNMVFLRSQQGMLNDLLHSRGHVFLNEVYDQLGFERSRAGSVVGWALSADGDNHIDFGLFDMRSMEARAFVNGWESNILLDFNVNGPIQNELRDWRPRV